MATGYSPNLVTDGLKILLDPKNTKSYPGSGTTWYDLSGNGHHATFSATPSITNGVWSLDGASDYCTITNDNTEFDDWIDEQTITIWMYHTYTNGRRNPWDQAYGGFGTWTHEQGNDINNYYGTAGSNAQPYTSRNSGTTTRSKWNCMSTVRNTSTHTWYNGTSSSSGANPYGSVGDTNANIRIGLGYAGYWQGDIGLSLIHI